MKLRRVTLGFIAIMAFSINVNAKDNNEVQVGPIAVQQDVNSISVTSNVTSFFSLKTENSALHLKARVIANLSDLQRKIGAIVDTFPLPHENCGSYSGNNPVVKLPTKSLTVSGNKALFSLSGNVEMWDCRENPIPNSKVEWEVKDIGFGIKTKVPVVTTWPGSPIKNMLASQSFDATLPLIAYAPDTLTAAIKFEKPNINLKGQYAFITEGVLSIAGIDINAEAQKALDKAISPTSLQRSVPSEYLDLNPKIEDLEFFDLEGQLAMKINLTAAVPAEKLNNFVRLMVDGNN